MATRVRYLFRFIAKFAPIKLIGDSDFLIKPLSLTVIQQQNLTGCDENKIYFNLIN